MSTSLELSFTFHTTAFAPTAFGLHLTGCCGYVLKTHVVDIRALLLLSISTASNQASKTLGAFNDARCDWLYDVSADEFKKIPGSPVAYWVEPSALREFFRRTAYELVSSD